MKKPIQKIFGDFLKENGCFLAYMKNWDKDFSVKPIEKRKRYIPSAFPWFKSDQGEHFWRDLNNKWQRFLIYSAKEDRCPGEYHTRCNDCGRFIKKELWVKKDPADKFHAHCFDCIMNYV